MSVKNRAFALAIGTGALIALSAPMASAASFAGPNGFNNDSVLNLSNNQVPVQTCASAGNTNVATEAQTVTGLLTSIAPSLSTGAVSPTSGNDCTQTPSNTSTTTNSATTASTDPSGSWSWAGHHHSSDPGTSGFNNDSVLNVSGNQVPVQTCASAANTNAATEAQALTSLITTVPTLTTGAVSPMSGNTCSQVPTNGSTTSNTVNS
jgi:hypothetical protein